MACTDGDHYSIQSVAETPSKIQFMGYELEVRKGFYPTVYGEDHHLHYLKIPCAASDKLEGIAEHIANALRYAGIKYENCGK